MTQRQLDIVEISTARAKVDDGGYILDHNSTYARIADDARLVREVFSRRHIRVRSGSALSELLRQVEILDRRWSAGELSDISVLYDAAHVNRLIEAVLKLQDDPDVQEALRRMAGSVMQPSNRAPSKGKDALWEIVLLAHLRNLGLVARFEDPPDIVMSLEGSDYPIACKKIWSENGVEKHIGKGGEQLQRFANGGVIALNLDELVPVGVMLEETNRESAGVFLDRFNLDFVERHRDTLQKAVMKGKCDGVWLSTCTPAWLMEENPSFNLFIQTSIWHLSDASKESVTRLQRFNAAVNGRVLAICPPKRPNQE